MTARKWAEIRKALMQGDCYNKEVKEWFKDDDNDTRIKLRDICLIDAKDSIAIVQQRIRFFREEVQKIHLKPDIIGVPKTEFDADVTYKPEVTLVFKQNLASVPRGKTAKTAKISYRLMDQTSSSLSRTELKTLGRNIHADFATPPYRFDKGKIIGWYIKPEDGLHLQIYCRTEDIGETVIKKVLQHMNKTFDGDIYKFTKPNRNSDPTPGTVKILENTVSKPIWRPTVTVEFDHAYINLHGDTQKRVLCDASGLNPNAFYRP